MSKRPFNTELGMPEGAALKADIAIKGSDDTSGASFDKAMGFGVTLRINAVRKFSFAYNVTSAQRKRANLVANRGRKTSSTEEAV